MKRIQERKSIRLVGLVMLAMLILPLLGGAEESAPTATPQAILIEALQASEPGMLELSIDKGCGAVYEHDEEIHITVRSQNSGYLWLVNFPADNDKKPHVIFPNQYQQDNYIQGGVQYTIPGDELFPFRYIVVPPDGKDILLAVVTETYRELTKIDFTDILTELEGTPTQEAQALASAVAVLPRENEAFAAAMCFFYTGQVPPSDGWALFIGHSAYHRNWLESKLSLRGRNDTRTVSLPDQAYGVADAFAMAEVLSDSFTHQRVLTGAQATYEAIQRAITGWLAQAPADATLLIYYAGHGVHDYDEAGVAQTALVSYDLELIHAQLLAEWLTQLSAQRVVFIADASFGGTTTYQHKRTFWMRGEWVTDFPPLTWGMCEQLVDYAGAFGWPGQLVAMSAAPPDEVAEESAAFNHGVYTYHLLQGLRGDADLYEDSVITAEELHFYVQYMSDLDPQFVQLTGLPVELMEVK